jgi:hypothetical protein
MIASALSSTPPITRLLNPNAELWLDTGVVHHHYWGKLLLLADSDSWFYWILIIAACLFTGGRAHNRVSPLRVACREAERE